ncbi:uncharacterized protein LOC119710772 [Motacilla alba alba]|uniref:uncharacterized protein LOC119710772 n=1 Tax=Motacilla alba alba TaxID=1094192 RepID=UPI0018D56EEB|nr:uncharacterized protein LOC119710772 [Motacilla alba alba]
MAALDAEGPGRARSRFPEEGAGLVALHHAGGRRPPAALGRLGTGWGHPHGAGGQQGQLQPPPRAPQGKLELSLELLSAQEAEERPVGKGREEPNKHPTLPEPRRPKSSFLWLRSPLRLIRYGVRWRYLLWLGVGLAALLLLLLLHSFFPVSTAPRARRCRPRARPECPVSPRRAPSRSRWLTRASSCRPRSAAGRHAEEEPPGGPVSWLGTPS